jgi:AcrR family transcriptional regulator
MPYDAAATRERLLDAAVQEFSRAGLAGARVDQIAEQARANKRAIYDYFGSKEGLFKAALARVIDELNQANPLTAEDLAVYAGRLFDYLHAHPEAVRMTSWWRLELPEFDPALDPAAAAGLRGRVDLVILAIGLANAWFLSADNLVTAAGQAPDDPVRRAAHRELMVAAASRLAG